MTSGWIILSRFLAAVGILLGIVMVGFLIGRVLAALARRRERAAQARRQQQNIADGMIAGGDGSMRGAAEAEGRSGYIHYSYRHAAHMSSATSPRTAANGGVQQPLPTATSRRTHHLVSKAELNELCPTFEKTRKGGSQGPAVAVNHSLRDESEKTLDKVGDAATQQDAGDEIFLVDEKCKLPEDSDMDPLELLGSDTDEEVCAVCLDDIEEGHAIKRLPCHHEFHAKCISKWVRRTNRCPLCNDKVKRDEARQHGAHSDSQVDLESGAARELPGNIASPSSGGHVRHNGGQPHPGFLELQSVVVEQAS